MGIEIISYPEKLCGLAGVWTCDPLIEVRLQIGPAAD